MGAPQGNKRLARAAQLTQYRSEICKPIGEIRLYLDGALKLARLTTKRTGFVAFMRGFHGRTVGALSLTWEPKYREPFQPMLDVTPAGPRERCA